MVAHLDNVAYLLLVEKLHLHGDVFTQQISGCPYKWTCGRDSCWGSGQGRVDTWLTWTPLLGTGGVQMLFQTCDHFSDRIPRVFFLRQESGRLQMDVSGFERGGVRLSWRSHIATGKGAFCL